MRCSVVVVAALTFFLGSAAAQRFDYYLFTLSWSPEFCHENPSNHTPECKTGANGGFVVHGLWPDSNNGKNPQNCAGDPFDPTAVPQGLDAFMPSQLFKHEWQTHGVCSGMNEHDYFARIASLYHGLTIPITNNGADQQISPAALRQKFASANPASKPASFAIQDNGKYLVAVKMCLGRSFEPISCPQPGDINTKQITIRGVK